MDVEQLPKKSNMSKQSVYYDGSYLKNNPDWHFEDSLWKAGQVLKIIQRNSLAPSQICEIGCGSGEILVKLHEQLHSANFKGYEVSPQAFNICSQKESSNIHFVLSNLLEESNAYFDCLLCIDVFEHVEDYIGFLKSLKTKSQYFIFHIPMDMTVSSVFRVSPILYARSKVGHLHYFSKETALHTLKDCGYEIEDYFYTSGALSLRKHSLKTKLAKLPRRFLYSLNSDLAVRLLGGYSLMVLAKSA